MTTGDSRSGEKVDPEKQDDDEMGAYGSYHGQMETELGDDVSELVDDL